MKKNDRLFIIAVLLCLVLSCAFAGVYKLDNERTHIAEIGENVIRSGDTFYYGCEDPVVENGNLVITGWAAPRERDLTYIDRHVLLEDGGVFYEINTIAVERGLTDFFDTGFTYDNGGIAAQCPVRSLKKQTYSLYLLIREESGNSYLIDMQKEVNLGGMAQGKDLYE